MLKAVSVAVGVMSIATSLSALAETKLATPKEITSYSIGVNLGRQIGQSKDAIDIDTFVVGLKDSFEGKKLQLSDEEMQKAMLAFRQDMEKKQMAQKPGAAEAAAVEARRVSRAT